MGRFLNGVLNSSRNLASIISRLISASLTAPSVPCFVAWNRGKVLRPVQHVQVFGRVALVLVAAGEGRIFTGFQLFVSSFLLPSGTLK